MHIDGGCHCGHVRYEAEIDPEDVSICHCTDCQSLTGSAFRVTVETAADSVRLTAAPPKLYVKTAANGARRLQYFCPECGSPLFTTGDGEAAAFWGIRWGSIRQRADLVPKRQIWCRSAVPWIADVPGLPGVAGDSDGVSPERQNPRSVIAPSPSSPGLTGRSIQRENLSCFRGMDAPVKPGHDGER